MRCGAERTRSGGSGGSGGGARRPVRPPVGQCFIEESDMRIIRFRLAPALIAAALVTATPAGAQPAPARASVFERYTQPIAIYKNGLGAFTRPISSSNKEAQAFFDQGFQMMYSFAKPEAIRSFRESWKRDPNCAICYWGEAWARSEEHTSELQSQSNLVCRLLLE